MVVDWRGGKNVLAIIMQQKSVISNSVLVVQKQPLNSNLHIRRLKIKPWKKSRASVSAANTFIPTTSSRRRFAFIP